MNGQGLEKRLEIALNSSSELLASIGKDEIKPDDIEEIWLKLFQHPELYNPETIVKMYKVLYESSMISLVSIKRKGHINYQNESESRRELSYKDAAVFLGCSVSTIKRLVGLKKLLPKRYNSKTVKISMAELKMFRESVVPSLGRSHLIEANPKVTPVES